MKTNIVNENYITEAQILLMPVFEDDVANVLNSLEGLKVATTTHELTGKKGQTLALKSFAKHHTVALVGLGKLNEVTDFDIVSSGGKLASLVGKCGKEVIFDLKNYTDDVLLNRLVQNLVIGFNLKSWEFNKYFTTKAEEKAKASVKGVSVVIPSHKNVDKAITHAEAEIEGIFLTRNLATEPANVVYSESFVEQIDTLTSLGLEVEVLGEKELEKLGMGALLAVNQASDHEAKVAIVKWNGGGKEEPVAFVGKGVTFDSGGLSIKPGAGMMEMKRDMTGAATVAGIMKTLALRKAKVNAVGVMGLVENMVDSRSMRPGDVIKSYSGKTIEVLNTDAEGRLVLADILYYTQQTFKPKVMIDLATLTGAIIIALGHSRAGLFGNNDELNQQLLKSGEQSGDKLWSLPVDDEYRDYVKSEIADICNISSPAGFAGSVTAAVFLKEFINGAKWAHIDIAGVAWKQIPGDTANKGATGFGVRLLDDFIFNYYESK